MSRTDGLWTGTALATATPADERTVASWLAILTAPGQPMQRHWDQLCAEAQALLVRGRDEAVPQWRQDSPAQPPTLYEED